MPFPGEEGCISLFPKGFREGGLLCTQAAFITGGKKRSSPGPFSLPACRPAARPPARSGAGALQNNRFEDVGDTGSHGVRIGVNRFTVHMQSFDLIVSDPSGDQPGDRKAAMAILDLNFIRFKLSEQIIHCFFASCRNCNMPPFFFRNNIFPCAFRATAVYFYLES